MDLTFLKEFIDYGGMFVIAISAFWWILKVDIPKRESRFERQLTAERQVYAERENRIVTTFNTDRQEILNQLTTLTKAVLLSSRTCAVNRSLGMIEYLMNNESITFEAASRKVREYLKLNGVALSEAELQQ